MGVNYGRVAGQVHKLDRATGAVARGEAETGAGAPTHGAALAQRRSAALAVQAAHCSAGKVWLISPPLPPRRSARSPWTRFPKLGICALSGSGCSRSPD